MKSVKTVSATEEAVCEYDVNGIEDKEINRMCMESKKSIREKKCW